MVQVLKVSLICLALGYLAQLGQYFLDTDYLNNYLRQHLLTLLIALLAINSSTMGIVLTKVRDLIDKSGDAATFTSTKASMLLAVREQICLIIFGALLLTVQSSELVPKSGEISKLLGALIIAVFFYSLQVLYDTAKGVLIIIDFDSKSGR